MMRPTLTSLAVMLFAGVLGTLASGSLAHAQSEGTGDPPSYEEAGGVLGDIAALVEGGMYLDSDEYLYGTDAADTIVYGDVISYGYILGCGYGYRRVGRGICVFAYSAGGTYKRGTFRYRDSWSDDTEGRLGLGGDPWNGGTYGADYIYAADQFGESYIYCGTTTGIQYSIAIDHFFDGTGTCGDATADFPADSEMEIKGDGGSDPPYGANDTIYGWNNSDALMGDGGSDSIHGGAGPDGINGDYGSDTISPDSCSSGTTEWLYGGFDDDGQDTIWYVSSGPCTIRAYGGPGHDTLMGSTLTYDYLYGGDGPDTLMSTGQLTDYLYGQSGDDVLCDGHAGGSDTCDGGTTGETEGDACESTTYCETRLNCDRLPDEEDC